MISHAEAIDRIGDAATERHGIERLTGDPSSDPELRAHIDSCAACQAEVRAWQQTAAALLLAAPASNAEVVGTMTDSGMHAEDESVPSLPGEARERVLATVLAHGVQRGGTSIDPPTVATMPGMPATGMAVAAIPVVAAPASPRPTRATRGPLRFRWLALAAAAVLLVFVAGALLGVPLGLVHGNQTADQLHSALAASGRILEQPNHRQAALIDADGAAVGSVLIDGQNGDIVVLSNGGDDEGNETVVYHCYLIRGDNPRTWLGEMVAQAGASFWAGHVDKVTDLGRPGDLIEVVDGGPTPEFTATF